MMAPVQWELGPGLREPNWLVISPDGHREYLPVTRRIVELAPSIAGWEFHPARPPKTYCLEFSFTDDSGVATAIDARSWRYVLVAFDDGTFDLIIEQPDLTELESRMRYMAACLVVDGLVGEATRLERFPVIEPVLVFESAHRAKATEIRYLADHLAARTRN